MKINGTNENQTLHENSASLLSTTASVIPKKGLTSSSETRKLKKIAPVKLHEQLQQPSKAENRSGLFINNSLRKNSTLPSKQHTRASSSRSAIDSVEPISSGGRSRSSRLGFDGAVKYSSPNSGEINPGSFAKLEQQRSFQGVSKSLIMNTTVEDIRTNPSFQGFVSPIQSSVSVNAPNENFSQQNANIVMSPNVDVACENLEMAIEESEIGNYAGDEESEKCPSIAVADDKVRSVCYATRTKVIWGAIICVAFIGAFVTIPCILLLGGSSNGNNFLELSDAKTDELVSSISSDICSESVPKSGACSPVDSDDVQQGGELCNLVAKSMINTTVYGDIALINAAICKETLRAPDITVIDIENTIAMESLVVVEMSGANIVNILNEALTATFGENGNFQAYPYAAGLRYSVTANLPHSKRLSNIEVNSGLRDSAWESIDIRRFYKVVTTESLANGGMGYASFQNVVDDWKDLLKINTGDAFYNYAMKNTDTEWSLLPGSEYSTQDFIGENVEPTIATVPSRLCHALIPSKPESTFCNSADVAHGGEVCNLVSWAIFDQNFGVDVVVLKGDVCAGDIEEGDFLERSFDTILSENKSLVTFDLLGSEIVTMISDSVSLAVNNGAAGNYPYAAGLRFDVSTISSPIVSNVQVLSSSGSWIPIVGAETYTIATTLELAMPSSAQDMGTTIQEEITDYAVDWKTLYKIPTNKVSTQSFV